MTFGNLESLPTISIIIAVFNGAKTLQRCIDSIVNQTYPYKEIIVIDGGSTDNTVEILKFSHDKIAYWESQRDRGIYHAFNKGVVKATGDWIFFLGADDYLWNSDVLTNVAQELNKLDSSVRIVYGRVALISGNNELLQIKSKSWNECGQAYRYYDGGDIDHQGVFHNRLLFSERGLFDESFKICGDYEFLLRELKNNAPLFVENLIISGRQIGGKSLQQKNGLQTYLECEKARQKHSLNSLFYLHYRFYNYSKELLRRLLLFILREDYVMALSDFYRKITLRPSIWTK